MVFADLVRAWSRAGRAEAATYEGLLLSQAAPRNHSTIWNRRAWRLPLARSSAWLRGSMVPVDILQVVL